MLAILLILIFVRPFISSLAYPCLDITYTFILLAFLAFWVVLKGLPIKEIRPLQFPLALFVFSLIISIIFSSDKMNSLYESHNYLSAILMFLIVIPLSDIEKKLIIKTIITASIIISILAIYQYFFGFKHLLSYVAKENISSPFVYDYLKQRRVFTPFVTPNALAGYLILVIPLTLIIKDKIKWVILLLLSTALLLTKSLGAFLSLFLGLLFYLYLWKNMSTKKVMLIIASATGCVFVFILRQIYSPEHLMPIFSLSRRLDYWWDALGIIKLHPFTGVGIGNFNLALSNYAHNSYLQIWAEMGISGLISLFWIIGHIFKSGFQNIDNSPYKNQIKCLLTANAVFIIHNFFDFTLFLPEISLIWWITLGLILFESK